jgi:hypothetical protein
VYSLHAFIPNFDLIKLKIWPPSAVQNKKIKKRNEEIKNNKNKKYSNKNDEKRREIKL